MTTPVHLESVEGWGETFPLIDGPLQTNAVVDVLRASFDGTEFVVDGLPPQPQLRSGVPSTRELGPVTPPAGCLYRR
jgi:hypothetical protein